MGADDRITIRLPAGMRERIRQARGDLAESEFVVTAITSLLEDAGPDDFPSSPPGPVAARPAAGVPSPGVLCMGPGCLQRDTSRYGLRRMPLCPACAAALTGQMYRKPQPVIPPAWRAARGRQATGAAS